MPAGLAGLNLQVPHGELLAGFKCFRALNRLELLAETLRAALNAIAGVAPDWLRTLAPPLSFGPSAS